MVFRIASEWNYNADKPLARSSRGKATTLLVPCRFIAKYSSADTLRVCVYRVAWVSCWRCKHQRVQWIHARRCRKNRKRQRGHCMNGVETGIGIMAASVPDLLGVIRSTRLQARKISRNWRLPRYVGRQGWSG